MDRRVLIAGLFVLLIAAGCDTTVPPNGSPAASASASPSGAAASQSLLPIPSLGEEFHGAPDLEARLPSTFDGQPLVVLSLRDSTFFENAAAELEQFRSVVQAVGGEGEEVSIAVANAAVAASPFNLAALRVEGADAPALSAAFETAALTAQQGGASSRASLGGKEIVKVTAPGNLVGSSYFYALDDTLFVVQARDDALAGRLLESLP